MVQIDGYKFITRHSKLFFIKDTQFWKQAELEGNNPPVVNPNLERENKELYTVIGRLYRLLESFGLREEEIAEAVDADDTEPIETEDLNYDPKSQGLRQTEWGTPQMEEPTYFPRSQSLRQTEWDTPQMEEPTYATKSQSLWQAENDTSEPPTKSQNTKELLQVEPTAEDNRKSLQGPTTELTDGENRKVLLDVADTK
jgi:hypothetical protein